jgi:hypothetical protein
MLYARLAMVARINKQKTRSNDLYAIQAAVQAQCRWRLDYFNRSLILSSPACAHASSSLPPGAPAAPIAPMTSAPSLIVRPPPKSSRCGNLENGPAGVSWSCTVDTRASVSLFKLTLV